MKGVAKSNWFPPAQDSNGRKCEQAKMRKYFFILKVLNIYIFRSQIISSYFKKSKKMGKNMRISCEVKKRTSGSFQTYAEIIESAIYDSEYKCMCLSDIYEWIWDKSEKNLNTNVNLCGIEGWKVVSSYFALDQWFSSYARGPHVRWCEIENSLKYSKHAT